MNIEIANRLVNLRKSNNLSQEALAAKLGISRQAVSKWERAEASPDTDNLILLARLYGVSLDELLSTEDEIPMPDDYDSYDSESSQTTGGAEGNDGKDATGYQWDNSADEYVHVGFKGIHVKDEDSEVHVGWNGIHVKDKQKCDEVHVDKNGVYVNGEKKDMEWIAHHNHFPITFIIIIAYLIIGCAWNAWHPGWLLFFMIPIWHTLAEAIEKKNAHHFAYPVLVVLAYLCMGFFWMMWHPGWVIFLTIPLYYSLVSYFQGIAENRRRKREWKNAESAGDGHEAE